MKKTFLYSAIAVLAVSACSVQNPEQPADVQGDLIYREFSAVISDDPATKVTFGEGSTETGKVSAQWQVGDEVLLVNAEDATATATVTYANGSTATFGAYTSSDFVPAEAYYPASMYDAAGTLTFSSTQTYSATAVQVPMTATASAGTDGQDSYYFNFSAADGYAIVRYSLIGDINIKEAYLYTRSEASFWAGDDYIAKRNYTLSFPNSLALSNEAQDIYFVVPTGTSVLTLEVVAAAPSTAYKSSTDASAADYSYYCRKSTAVELTSRKVCELPAIDLTEANLIANRPLWKFGSENGGANNFTVSNKGTIDASSSTDHITVTMGSTKTVLNKNTADNDTTTLNCRADLILNGLNVNVGTYRYMAIKSNIPSLISGGLAHTGDWVSGASMKFDVTTYGQWRNGSNKTCTVSTTTDKCQIWVYDMLVHFYSNGNKVNSFIPTATTLNTDGSLQLKIADVKTRSIHAGGTEDSILTSSTYDVYWIGFFNSIEEVMAFVQSEDGVAPTTSYAGRK